MNSIFAWYVSLFKYYFLIEKKPQNYTHGSTPNNQKKKNVLGHSEGKIGGKFGRLRRKKSYEESRELKEINTEGIGFFPPRGLWQCGHLEEKIGGKIRCPLC